MSVTPLPGQTCPKADGVSAPPVETNGASSGTNANGQDRGGFRARAASRPLTPRAFAEVVTQAGE
ncbi:hypothetical protein JCM16408A_06890 [Methylobacterium phyllosphaerae]